LRRPRRRIAARDPQRGNAVDGDRGELCTNSNWRSVAKVLCAHRKKHRPRKEPAMNPLEQKAADVAQLASTLLANGYYQGDDIAPGMRGEVPLRLMYALRDAGVQRWQLEALVLALRDIGEAAHSSRRPGWTRRRSSIRWHPRRRRSASGPSRDCSTARRPRWCCSRT